MKTRIFSIAFLVLCYLPSTLSQVNISLTLDQETVPMSRDLIGVFFEDINYAADGGLYAELVQNRSFEYYVVDGYTNLGPLTAWSGVQEGGASVALSVVKNHPLNQHNTNCLKLVIYNQGRAAGVKNTGFDGIALKQNENYFFSAYLKRDTDHDKAVVVQLKSSGGYIIASDTIPAIGSEWQQYHLTLKSKITFNDAALYILPQGSGNVYMDMVSLFPENTFKNRRNGLRADLAQAIADLQPRFVRFPGGCISHGKGLDNAYRWKHTVGDVAVRKPNWNLWGYHQSYGLGFYEYFLFCEDLGAKPLPVLPVGVSCQFRNREVAPLEDMGPWIQDAIDLVEFANGDTSTTWGALRAEMGHPEPFHMEYICLGNEEDDIPEFRVRFMMITDSLRKYCPDIKIIGTSGPGDAGSHYTSLWEFSRENQLDVVDEHYYQSTDWFLNNNHRYDNFDRQGPKVFIGEYASRDDRLYNAIAEAAYLTGVERNADIIELTCYAPLFCNDKHQQWHPDLIRFDNTQVVKTASYYVQQMYGTNPGDEYLASQISYDPSFKPEGRNFKGKFGAGTWNTQAQFDDLTVSDGDNLLFSEDFSAGSSNWQVLSGSFNAAGGVYSQTANNEPALSIFNSAVDTDHYTFRIKAKKTGGYEGFLIPFAYQDQNNYYWLNIGGWNNTQHAVEKVSNGNKSVLVTSAGRINSNQWYEIRLEARGETMECYLDDNRLFAIPMPPSPVTASVSRDNDREELIFKIVNSGNQALTANINITGGSLIDQQVDCQLLTGDATQRNSLAAPELIKPGTYSLAVGNQFQCQLAAYSMQVFRVKEKGSALNKLHQDKSSLLKIIPNPVYDQKVDIVFEKPDRQSYSLKLYDSNGKLIFQKDRVKDRLTSIDTGRLPASTYLVQVVHNQTKYTGQLILN